MDLERIEVLAERLRRITVIRDGSIVWSLLRPPYEMFLRLASRGRGIRLSMPGGIDRFRFDIAFRNFNFGATEVHVYQWLSDTLKLGMSFYDIGAFIGHYSLCAAKRVGPLGRVFAFEPADANYTYLLRHIHLNDFEQCVRPYQFIIGDKDATDMTFFLQSDGVHSGHGIAFQRDVKYIDRARLKIVRKRMRSIDSIVSETGAIPDVIKIDVEGAEERVLRGAIETLRRYRPRVVCSIHPFWLIGLNDSPESLLSYMRSLGYRALDFSGQEKHELGYEEVLLLPD